MKIKILKNVWVDIEKIIFDEIWDKQLKEGEEYEVKTINTYGKYSQIVLSNGDIMDDVPVDAFKEINDEKKENLLWIN